MSLHPRESSDGVKSRITAFYQRVTAEESFKRNLSIPAQRAEAEELARKNGWAPVRHYAEPRHAQASVWQRPAFLELVRDIEAGRILRVVARHEDRFWRDLEVQQRFLEILRRYDVELWAFRGQLDYKTAHGKLVLQITGATAEFEKNITGERIRKVTLHQNFYGPLAHPRTMKMPYHRGALVAWQRRYSVVPRVRPEFDVGASGTPHCCLRARRANS